MNGEKYLVGLAHGVEAMNESRGQSLSPRQVALCSWCLRPKERGHHGCYCDDDDEGTA